MKTKSINSALPIAYARYIGIAMMAISLLMACSLAWYQGNAFHKSMETSAVNLSKVLAIKQVSDDMRPSLDIEKPSALVVANHLRVFFAMENSTSRRNYILSELRRELPAELRDVPESELLQHIDIKNSQTLGWYVSERLELTYFEQSSHHANYAGNQIEQSLAWFGLVFMMFFGAALSVKREAAKGYTAIPVEASPQNTIAP